MRYHRLSPSHLTHLQHYRYAAGVDSILDKYVLNRFWNWTVEYFPLWLAPNLITAISLMHAFFTYALLWYYSPTLSEPSPSWVYYICCVFLFIYQTLDGIDGKQARRTGSSSPLGQLFDHGCDAICCFISGICVCSVFGFGPTTASFLCLALHILPFFFSNWEESVTGVMRFGAMAVSEGQAFVMGLFVVTGMWGSQIWVQRYTLPQCAPIAALNAFVNPDNPDGPMIVELRYICLVAGLGAVCYQASTSTYQVIDYLSSRPSHSWPETTIRPLVQFLLFVALSAAWVLAPFSIYSAHPRTFLLTIGCLFGYQLTRLILARVTSDRPSFPYSILLPFPILVLNSYLATPILGLDQLLLTRAYFLFVLVFYSHLIVSVITQICDHLGIHAFRIKKKEKIVEKADSLNFRVTNRVEDKKPKESKKKQSEQEPEPESEGEQEEPKTKRSRSRSRSRSTASRRRSTVKGSAAKPSSAKKASRSRSRSKSAPRSSSKSSRSQKRSQKQ